MGLNPYFRVSDISELGGMARNLKQVISQNELCSENSMLIHLGSEILEEEVFRVLEISDLF